MVSKIKLLFLLDLFDAFHVDASERAINEITIMMDKRWEVHVTSSRMVRYEKLTCDHKVHKVTLISSPDSILSRMFYLVFSIYKGVKIVKKYNIHAIMCKGGHLSLGLAAYLISRMTSRKCIVRVNSNVVLAIILFIQRLRIPMLSRKMFLEAIGVTLRKIEILLLKHVDSIVTQGPTDYERIRKITAKVTFIPLWVDTQEFRSIPKGQVSHLRKELLELGNAKVILFVGRLQSDKDPATLFLAFRRLLEVRNDVVLVVMGTGPDKKEYIELARQLGIMGKVKFLGYIRHDEIAKYYSIADVYVLTSVWEEWSNTIMEAMACGIPVIATNVGANPYLVKHRETGFLVPLKSPTVLAEKIAYVLDHPKEVEKISSRARLSIKKYTKEDIGESYKAAIERVISEK